MGTGHSHGYCVRVTEGGYGAEVPSGPEVTAVSALLRFCCA